MDYEYYCKHCNKNTVISKSMEKSSKKEHCSKCGKELQRVFSSFIIPKDKKYKNYMEKNKSNALEGIPLGDVPGDKDYIEPMEGGQDPLFTPKP